MVEMRTNVGHLFPVCCLTGTLGVPGDGLEEQSPFQVSASIRVLAVEGDAVELKVRREKKVTFYPQNDNKQKLLSQINLGIIIIHLCVNHSEVEKHLWINSALGASAAFPHERDTASTHHRWKDQNICVHLYYLLQCQLNYSCHPDQFSPKVFPAAGHTSNRLFPLCIHVMLIKTSCPPAADHNVESCLAAGLTLMCCYTVFVIVLQNPEVMCC